MLEIPGYREAIAEEAEAREMAFLPLSRELCGVQVRAMTLRDLAIRFRIGCPFMTRTDAFIRPGDIASFIWQLRDNGSPRYDPRAPNIKGERSKFLKKLARVPYGDAIKEINDYLDWTFLDAPSGKAGGSPPKMSFVASVVDIIARNYHWSEAEILDVPMVRLYQYVRGIILNNNPNAILFNRKSDKIRGDFLRELNKKTTE